MSTSPSPKAQEFLRIFNDMLKAIADGHDAESCRAVITDALRILFPPVPDSDPRMWRTCLACDDTGYLFRDIHPPIYGGKTPVRVARPCSCEHGQRNARAIAGDKAPKADWGRTRG